MDDTILSSGASTRWLKLEFATLFVLVPLVIAAVLPPSWMFPALFAATAIGLVLLALTPGFRWASLLAGGRRIGWGLVLATGVITALAGIAVLWMTSPAALFILWGEDAPRLANGWSILWVIAVFYPWVSALPQELVFRPLFFRRYAAILPDGDRALLLNAALFSLAHLMYWSVVVALMTFAGGLLFAWSYERRGNFPEAVLLHSVAGVALFAVGMGVYFYSGNVVRPF